MKTYLLTFLFVFSAVLLNAQITNGKVYYTISFKPLNDKLIDSIAKKTDTEKIKMSKWVKDFLKNTEDITGVLSFTKKESLYELEEKMQLDEKKTSLSRIMAGGKTKFYTNTKTKEYLKQVNTDEVFRIETQPLKWKITQETKTIGKYICYKAIVTKEIEKRKGKSTRTTIAWFTPTIPVNFGPNKYFGLPGLVLEIVEGKKSVKATKIALNTSENIKVKRFTKGEKITEEEYNQKGKDFFKNLDRKRF